LLFKNNFDSVLNILPYELRNILFDLSDEVEEIRLRVNKKVSYTSNGVSKPLDCITTSHDLEKVIEIATQSSFHAFERDISKGHITISGGHRIGICGTAIISNQECCGYTNISSVNIRIASELIGVSDEFTINNFKNTLIVSPPGYGKTTFLRDYIRRLSYKYRVCLCDETNELSASVNGIMQFDLGQQTDVIIGLSKDKCIDQFIKNMSPQIIAFDEITSFMDVKCIINSSFCGCGFLGSLHSSGIEEMLNRPIYNELINAKIFKRCIVISMINGKRNYCEYEI